MLEGLSLKTVESSDFKVGIPSKNNPKERARIKTKIVEKLNIFPNK